MSAPNYRAGIVGLGFIGAADQVSGDALGQQVEHLHGTHLAALAHHPRVELVAGSSCDAGRRQRFGERTGASVVYCEKLIATLLVVNHNRRFNPNGHRLRDLVARGDLGDLTSASLQWSSGRLGGVSTHIFDATCMLTGRRIQAVSGTLDRAGPARLPRCTISRLRRLGHAAHGRRPHGHSGCGEYSRLPLQIALNGTKGWAVTAGDEVAI